LCSASAAVLAGTFGAGRATRYTAASAASITTLLLLVAPLTQASGVLGWIVTILPPLVAGTLFLLGLERLIRHTVNAAPPAGWQRLRPLLRRWRGLRWLVALALAVPLARFNSFGLPIDWYTFTSLLSSVENCLRLITLGLLVVVLRQLTLTGPSGRTEGSLWEIRTIVLLLALLGLLTSTAVVSALPVSFLVGWSLIELWLLRAPDDRGDRVTASPAARQQNADAVLQVAANAARTRANSSLETGLRKELAAGSGTAQEQAERIKRVTELAVADRRIDLSSDSAFSGYGGEAPWQRARTLALAGFVAGLPWVLFDVRSVLETAAEANSPYHLLDAAAGALVLLRFAIAGLVLGAIYPLVRGRTGLTKGLALFVALSGPSLCLTLLPDPGAEGAASAALLQITQWLAFGLILGLAADLRELWRAGLGWRSLRDLHNLTALTASLSSVAAAVVIATVTAVGTGAAGIVVDRVLTPPPIGSATTGGR
jgi:hypothetical protein